MGICTRRRTGRCGTFWTAFTRRRTMPNRARRGPDVDHGQRERRRLDGSDALTCWVGWWACEDVNIGLYPERESTDRGLMLAGWARPWAVVERGAVVK